MLALDRLYEDCHAKNQPFFSVILYLEDGDHFVKEAISSLLKQTHPYFELLLIDDEVRDETILRALFAAARDPRVRVCHLDKKKGYGAANNQGVQKAKGDYVWFPHAQDTVEPEFLQVVATRLCSQYLELLISGYTSEFFNHKGEFAYEQANFAPTSFAPLILPEKLLALEEAHLLGFMYSSVFAKSLADKIPFEKKGSAAQQDFFFMLAALEYAKASDTLASCAYHFKRRLLVKERLAHTHDIFLAHHRRIAALYTALSQHDALLQETKERLAALYVAYIADELVRMADQQTPFSQEEQLGWIGMLYDDPLFAELISSDCFHIRAHEKLHHLHVLLAKRSTKRIRAYAHFLHYKRSFGPGSYARSE